MLPQVFLELSVGPLLDSVQQLLHDTLQAASEGWEAESYGAAAAGGAGSGESAAMLCACVNAAHYLHHQVRLGEGAAAGLAAVPSACTIRSGGGKGRPQGRLLCLVHAPSGQAGARQGWLLAHRTPSQVQPIEIRQVSCLWLGAQHGCSTCAFQGTSYNACHVVACVCTSD